MNYVDIILCMQKSLCLHIAHTLVTVHAIYRVQWKGIFNTNSELLQNYTEKQIIPFKTTVNWLFNDIWCYLVVGCFDWKIVIFQQIVVRVYYILNLTIFLFYMNRYFFKFISHVFKSVKDIHRVREPAWHQTFSFLHYIFITFIIYYE